LDPKSITVGKRIRRDLDAGIAALAASIREVGQLQPVVVDEKNNLIAGARRLRACELLERDVDAVVAEDVTDAIKRLKAERDENTCRLDFTPEEAVECGRAIEKLEAPKAKGRQKAGTGANGSGGRGHKKPSGKLPEGLETREAAASAVGMSPRTYDKAKAVVEAAERDPALRPIVEEMNRSGKVDPAYQEVARRSAAKGLPGGLTVKSEVERSPSFRWTKLLTKVAGFARSVTEHGSFRTLARRWNAEARREALERLKEMRRRINEWIKELEEI
jgi:ParB family chromosome partitioning protein